MKKFLTIAITLVVLASLVCMAPASAASAELVAKANTPTLDGVVADGEYGEAYVVKNLPGKGWTNGDNQSATPENITYAFAWDEAGLYIAVSGYFSGLNPQFNANPNGVIADGQQGLFFTFTGDGVKQHNHNSAAGTGSAGGDLVATSKTVIGEGVMEVFIPVECFQIAGAEDLAFEGGYKLTAIVAGHAIPNAGEFSYFCAEGGAGNWQVQEINFGSIELAAAPAPTGDFGLIALAFVALSSIAAKKRKA